MPRVHAFDDDALSDHDAVGLANAIQQRDVSIAEVIEAAITRAEHVDPELRGIAYRDYERARAEARDPRPGFFAGVPTWVKDNVDVAGMPTMHGSEAWTPRNAPGDGDWARMYLATGLVPLGKTRLSEFGFSPSAEDPCKGAVRSPWDTRRTAGASSAGSAAMVAAGVVPIAHANDGGGSIRIPASVNGLVGLKPTRGRLAQDAVLRQQPVRIVSDGVVTRSVRDTAVFLREAERVYRPLHLPPIGDLTRPGRGRLRIGLNTTGLVHGASAEATELTQGVAQELERLGHRVEEVAPPVDAGFPDDFVLYWSSLALFLVRGGRRAHGRSWDPGRLEPFTLGLARHAQRHLHRLPGAIRRLRRTTRRTHTFFERYDVALSPTLATETPEVGYLDPHLSYDELMDRIMRWVAFTPLQNATGDPAVSLPLATTADGMPLGMMFAAGAGREATLVELAYELEEALPFASIRG